MDSPDLQTKYQKLAAEYARLRAQIPILKKGVLDEQSKTESLKNDIKQKDQKVRKFEQEVDSLTFRNDQLTKRVAILQEELDGRNSSKSKKTVWHAVEQPVMPTENETVLSEELQSKIEENARLHKDMYDLNVQHNESVIVMQNQLARYEKEASEHNQAMESLSSAFKAQVDALLEEKAMLEVKLLSMDSQSKQFKSRADSAEMQLCSISQELSLGLTSSFSQDDVSRSVSVQSFAATPDADEPSGQLVLESVAFGKQFIHSLSNYFTYSEQRAVHFPAQLETNLPRLLNQAAVHLKPVDSALKNLIDKYNDKNSVNLKDLAETFAKFVEFHSNVNTSQIETLGKEKSSHNELLLKNQDLQKSFENFHAGLESMSGAVTGLYIAMKSEIPSTERAYRDVLESARNLHENCRELSKLYNSKVSLEHMLDSSPKFKTANECVVSSLISIVTVLDKLVSLLRSNADNFNRYVQHSPASLKSVDSLDTPAITQQVASLKDKLMSLESEKEHFMLETQLLQAKLDEKNKIISEMEKSDDVEENIIRERSETENSQYVDLSALGAVSGATGASGDNSLREKLIKQHYSKRLSDLTSQLHFADSKAVNFHHECSSLHQRLSAQQKLRVRAEADLELSQTEVKQLRDELSTTSARYEDQMTLMSEHIAQLNDQLSTHREQLDSLKMTRSNNKGK